MFNQPYESKFWWRLLLAGGLAGAMAGGLATSIMLVLFTGIANLLGSGSLPIMIIMGGVYGIGQGMAQFLSLREQIPRSRRSLRTNFISTAVGSAVTAGLLLALLAIGFATLLNRLGFSSALVLALAAFIVGGFGGIAQAIVERFLLRTIVHSSYWRWIVPLALLGHISGALAGIAATPFLLPVFAN